MTVYIAPIGAGLGGAIVSLPAVERAVKLFPKVILVLRSPRQYGVDELVEGLSGWMTEPEYQSLRLQEDDLFINLRDHILQTDKVWGSPEFFAEYPDYYISKIVQQIASDKGLFFEPAKVAALPYKLVPEAQGKIAFVPATAGVFKHWATENWLSLAKQLEKIGLSCFILGQADKSPAVQDLINAGIEWIPSPKLTDARDLLSSALSVVSVDTGLMHLAVRQLRPVVSMYTRPASFLRTEKNCFPVLAPACDPQCIKQLFETTKLEADLSFQSGPSVWQCVLPCEQACMSQVSVSEVFGKLEAAIQFASE